MLIDLALGLAVFYLAACALFLRWARRRGAPHLGALTAFTVLAGWTVWGLFAALLYVLIAAPAPTRRAPPAPSPAGR